MVYTKTYMGHIIYHLDLISLDERISASCLPSRNNDKVGLVLVRDQCRCTHELHRKGHRVSARSMAMTSVQAPSHCCSVASDPTCSTIRSTYLVRSVLLMRPFRRLFRFKSVNTALFCGVSLSFILN